MNMTEKRKVQLNEAISRAMIVDLLNDVIGDLHAFQNIEQIQAAIKFLENTKLELKFKVPKS